VIDPGFASTMPRSTFPWECAQEKTGIIARQTFVKLLLEHFHARHNV